MQTVNVYTQLSTTVSTPFAKVSPEAEIILKSCNSMADILKKEDSNPMHKKAAAESLALVISLIQKIFQRLSLKEKSLIGTPAPSDSIECLWSFAEIINTGA